MAASHPNSQAFVGFWSVSEALVQFGCWPFVPALSIGCGCVGGGVCGVRVLCSWVCGVAVVCMCVCVVFLCSS
jgi:hypothetical protein